VCSSETCPGSTPSTRAIVPLPPSGAPTKEPSRNAALVPARVHFGCAHLQRREAKLFENARGRRVAVQSRRADFRDAESASGKLDQQGSQLGAEPLTPERGEDRVPNGSDTWLVGMPTDTPHGYEITTRPERGTETVVATSRRS